jgi:Uncharacterized conserved protein
MSRKPRLSKLRPLKTRPSKRWLLLAMPLWLLLLPALPAAAEAPTGIDVQGHATVHASPDRARLALAAQFTDTDPRTAEQQAEQVVKRFVAAARHLGIAKDNLATAAISVDPQYSYDHGQRTLQGYQATRRITVTVRRLDQLGPLLAGAADAGINHISPPELYASDSAALHRKALALAAEDALAQAQALAQALHLRLGPVVHIAAGDGNSTPPPRPMMAFKAASSESAAPTVLPGRLDFPATVQVHFALLPP